MRLEVSNDEDEACCDYRNDLSSESNKGCVIATVNCALFSAGYNAPQHRPAYQYGNSQQGKHSRTPDTVPSPYHSKSRYKERAACSEAIGPSPLRRPTSRWFTRIATDSVSVCCPRMVAPNPLWKPVSGEQRKGPLRRAAQSHRYLPVLSVARYCAAEEVSAVVTSKRLEGTRPFPRHCCSRLNAYVLCSPPPISDDLK